MSLPPTAMVCFLFIVGYLLLHCSAICRLQCRLHIGGLSVAKQSPCELREAECLNYSKIANKQLKVSFLDLIIEHVCHGTKSRDSFITGQFYHA